MSDTFRLAVEDEDVVRQILARMFKNNGESFHLAFPYEEGIYGEAHFQIIREEK